MQITARITVVLWVAATACAVDVDDGLGTVSDGLTQQESGLAHSGQWMDLGGYGGFRGINHPPTIYAADNGKLLWAISQPGGSGLTNHGVIIRNFIGAVENGAPHGGMFDRGLWLDCSDYANPATCAWRRGGPRGSDDPAVATMPSFGVVAFTAAYPTAPDYQGWSAWIERVLRKQHGYVLQGERRGRNDFTEPEAIALFMASAAIWHGHTGKAEFRNAALDAWRVLSAKRSPAGWFHHTTFRNLQIQAAIRETIKHMGGGHGLRAADTFLWNAMRPVRNGRSVAGPDTCHMTQCLALRIFTGGAPEPKVLGAFAQQRLCTAGGWLWDGNTADGRVAVGPVEAQAMAILAESKMRRFEWDNRAGVCIPY